MRSFSRKACFERYPAALMVTVCDFPVPTMEKFSTPCGLDFMGIGTAPACPEETANGEFAANPTIIFATAAPAGAVKV